MALTRAQTNHRNKLRMRRHRRTKLGLLSQRHADMRKRVNGKDPRAQTHIGQPLVARDKFIEWALDHDDFNDLFQQWEKGGYEYRYTPSIDRIDPRFGYEFWNMQWVCMKENVARNNTFRTFGKII